MNWFTLYDSATGALKGHASGSGDPPTPPVGCTVIVHTERQDQGKQWDPASQSWEDFPAPTEIRLDELFSRLTAAERNDYANKVATGNANMMTVKSNVATFRETHQLVDLTSPYTIGMIDLLVSEGVLTATRKAEILA